MGPQTGTLLDLRQHFRENPLEETAGNSRPLARRGPDGSTLPGGPAPAGRAGPLSNESAGCALDGVRIPPATGFLLSSRRGTQQPTPCANP